jgi:hypothetical protein
MAVLHTLLPEAHAIQSNPNWLQTTPSLSIGCKSLVLRHLRCQPETKHVRAASAFQLPDAEEINAFALPRGFFVVNTGVVLNADSEAEMASMMAVYVQSCLRPDGVRRFLRENPVEGEKEAGHDVEIVTASEFNDVSDRLIVMQNRRKPDEKEMNTPRLRRAPGGGPIPVDENGNEQKQKDDQDDRPTLKRRDP